MTSLARPLAAGLAGAGLAVALAGCTAPPADGGADAGPGTDAGTGADASASYADGSYTATGEYQAPSGAESVTVTLTLEGDVVTEVTVEGHATDPQAQGFQDAFAGGVAAEVVGRDIDELEVSRVAGSSLTSSGFRSAVEAIKAEALES